MGLVLVHHQQFPLQMHICTQSPSSLLIILRKCFQLFMKMELALHQEAFSMRALIDIQMLWDAELLVHIRFSRIRLWEMMNSLLLMQHQPFKSYRGSQLLAVLALFCHLNHKILQAIHQEFLWPSSC